MKKAILINEAKVARVGVYIGIAKVIDAETGELVKEISEEYRRSNRSHTLRKSRENALRLAEELGYREVFGSDRL